MRKPLLKTLVRKSVVRAELARRSLPPLQFSAFRFRAPSRERILILATLTGATAVFLLMVLQMAQTHPQGPKEDESQQQEPPAGPAAQEEADLDSIRLARIEEMSKPVPRPEPDPDELSFVDQMEQLRKRPFLKRDQADDESRQAFTRSSDHEPPLQGEGPKPVSVPDTADEFANLDDDLKFDPDPEGEIAASESSKPNEGEPSNVKPTQPASPEDSMLNDPFGEPESVARTEDSVKDAAGEPETDDPFGEPPSIAASDPAPPSVPEATPPTVADSTRDVNPPDVDLDVRVDRVPARNRTIEPAEEEPERFLVRSDDAASKKTPDPQFHDDADEEAWTRADSSDKGALLNPEMLLETKPTWRLVAPIARRGDPTDINSADSAEKELNIVIVKTAPRESAVKQILSYEIIVRNDSAHAVDGLIIEERVPESLQVADVNPKANRFENQILTWHLESFGPREERKLEVNLFAVEDGTAESLTIARPFAAVTSETQVDPTHLRLEVRTVGQAVSGRVCPLVFRVTNTGDSPVEGVVLHADLPGELTHAKGRSLELPIDRLEPGETRTARLNPRARGTGTVVTPASLQIGGSRVASANASVRVVQATARARTPERRRLSPCPCCPCWR